MSKVEVIVGRLGRAHGLSGELCLDVVTDSPEERFAVGAKVWAGERALTVRGFRLQSGRGVIGFEEIGDRDAAAALTGGQLVARLEVAQSPSEPDTFYDHQLIGLLACSEDGTIAGPVSRVDHLGFQDNLVVMTPAGERLVPFVAALVPEVDLVERRIVINAIPGLLEDAE